MMNIITRKSVQDLVQPLRKRASRDRPLKKGGRTSKKSRITTTTTKQENQPQSYQFFLFKFVDYFTNFANIFQGLFYTRLLRFIGS